MPPYELAVIVRNGLQRPDLKEALKRLCGHIHLQGGVIRSMENLGEKALPMSIIKDYRRYHSGNYFFLGVHLPSNSRTELRRVFKDDLDVLHHTLIVDKPEPPRPCLYKPCVFGEVVKPAYDRSVFKTNTLRKLKNKKVLK